jgi:hypothetical protein
LSPGLFQAARAWASRVIVTWSPRGNPGAFTHPGRWRQVLRSRQAGRTANWHCGGARQAAVTAKVAAARLNQISNVTHCQEE